MIDMTHSISLAPDRLVCCYCFLHDLYIFFDYEIMQLPNTAGTPCVLSNVTTKLGGYKDALQVSPKVFVGLA